MKSYYKSLISMAVCSALIGCDGSGSGAPDRQALAATSAINGGVVANDASGNRGAIGGEQSLLLDGEPVASSALASDQDLTVSDATVTSTDSGLSFTFTVADTGGLPVALDELSIALEVASSGSFADSYRIPLFDIRESAINNANVGVQLTARSAGVDLPFGNYDARLVVNPNWQHVFDFIPKTQSDIVPFRYIAERDYRNNASNVISVESDGTVVCAEDVFENNDDVFNATQIPEGGRIEGSLCLDDVDFYSLTMSDFEVASLSFAYTDESTNQNPATRYLVLDSDYNRITEPTVAREANRIVINASDAGQYYVALFGKRSSYRITRAFSGGFLDDAFNDSLFHAETINGPQSWLYGNITLHRLAFSEVTLRDQVINCGRITTQYNAGQPVAYVTPDHFAEVHEFRFLSSGSYLVDGERRNGWHLQDGDISHADWYTHGYPGYAERVSRNQWRYWGEDGLGYVDCTLEINR